MSSYEITDRSRLVDHSRKAVGGCFQGGCRRSRYGLVVFYRIKVQKLPLESGKHCSNDTTGDIDSIGYLYRANLWRSSATIGLILSKAGMDV